MSKASAIRSRYYEWLLTLLTYAHQKLARVGRQAPLTRLPSFHTSFPIGFDRPLSPLVPLSHQHPMYRTWVFHPTDRMYLQSAQSHGPETNGVDEI